MARRDKKGYKIPKPGIGRKDSAIYSMRRRHARRKLILILFAAFIGISGILRLKSYVLKSSFFKVDTIKVERNRLLTDYEVILCAGIEEGENIFDIDLEEAAAKVESHSMVKRAEVSVKLPSTVVISLEERETIAFLDLDGLYPVDAEGVLLPEMDILDLPDIPILTGIKDKNYRVSERLSSAKLVQGIKFVEELKRADPLMLSQISKIRVDSPQRVVFYLVGDEIEVRGKWDDVERQAKSLRALLEYLQIDYLERPVYVDLTFKGRIVAGWRS